MSIKFLTAILVNMLMEGSLVGIQSLVMGCIGALLGVLLVRILESLNPILLEEKSLWSALGEKRLPRNAKEYGIVLLMIGGFLILGAVLPFGLTLLFFEAVLFLLTGCFFTDLQEGVLLDAFTLGLLVLGLAASLVPITVNFQEAATGAALGYGFFWLFNFLYKRFRGIEGMYPGDFKLNAGLGACLGWKLLIPALLLGLFFLVLFTLVTHLFLGRERWEDLKEREIPYGCFATISGGWILIALPA